MKLKFFVGLFICYCCYSIWVYSKGTATAREMSSSEIAGKELFQQYNCQTCHQIYGMGGYLGPDLTYAISDKRRGEFYVKAILKSGGSRMPNFNLSDDAIEKITTYLKYVDNHAINSTK